MARRIENKAATYSLSTLSSAFTYLSVADRRKMAMKSIVVENFDGEVIGEVAAVLRVSEWEATLVINRGEALYGLEFIDATYRLSRSLLASDLNMDGDITEKLDVRAVENAILFTVFDAATGDRYRVADIITAGVIEVVAGDRLSDEETI